MEAVSYETIPKYKFYITTFQSTTGINDLQTSMVDSDSISNRRVKFSLWVT